MPDNLDPLKPLHEASFVEGQRAVAKDAAARRLEEQLKTLGKVGQVAAETLDQAERLAEDGDPHKRKLADVIKNGIIGAVDDAANGRHPAGEAREAVSATPLSSSSSTASRESLPASTPERPGQGALEPPPKRKRGRPPKNAAK